jgi:hypothetical protein
LWRNANVNGVFIPQIVKSRRYKHVMSFAWYTLKSKQPSRWPCFKVIPFFSTDDFVWIERRMSNGKGQLHKPVEYCR